MISRIVKLRFQSRSIVLRRILVALIACTVALSSAASASTVYFFHPLRNDIVGPQLAQFIGQHSQLVLLQARDQAEHGGPGMQTLVDRLHASNPNLKVLVYGWATHYDAKVQPGSWNAMTRGAQSHAKYSLHVPRGSVLSNSPDPSNPGFQDALASEVANYVNRVGADGAIFDLAFMNPRMFGLEGACKRDAAFCVNYATGMQQLFGKMQAALAGHQLFFNGIWNDYPGNVSDQARLLPYAHGATIEYFGLNTLKDFKQPDYHHSFTQNILPYLQVASRYTNKEFLFFGRNTWHYTSYQEDYLWQRYLYCAYLLVRRPGTLFKYNATFQVPTSGGRTGGLATYADWSLPLGNALGAYRVDGGIYSREFDNAWVFVAPDDGKGGSVKLPETLYTPEGVALTGVQTLKPGTGLLLLKHAPASQRVDHTWSLDHDPQLAQWLGGSAIDAYAGAPAYVALPAYSATSPVHDLRLDSVRILNPDQTLRLRIYLNSPSAHVLVVAEIDDGDHRWDHAVVDVTGAAGAKMGSSPVVRYRVPLGQIPGRWPLVRAEPVPTGRWVTVTLKPALFKGTSMRLDRWVMMRLQGPLGISDVMLGP